MSEHFYEIIDSIGDNPFNFYFPFVHGVYKNVERISIQAYIIPKVDNFPFLYLRLPEFGKEWPIYTHASYKLCRPKEVCNIEYTYNPIVNSLKGLHICLLQPTRHMPIVSQHTTDRTILVLDIECKERQLLC